MTDIDKRNLIAQWAFDTRPVLLRFHLWLEDVEVERAQAEAVSRHAFAPRGIARCLAMTSAATALGTRLFGGFGEGAGKDKAAYNQVKKAADAISAYVMSEGLWHLTRSLPENHAIMVSLGEGLMPKAGETPEMGANPLLGFGRVYARPEVARIVDRRVRRLLNEPGHTFEQFHDWLQRRGITLWGAAVDTLENTSRFAEGKADGPDGGVSPLRLAAGPVAPVRVVHGLPDGARGAWPKRPTAHRCCSITGRRARRSCRRSRRPTRACAASTSTSGRCGGRAAWRGWASCGRSGRRSGVHLVEDGWKTPSGLAVFTDSGTYAPTFLVGSWKDAAGATHVFLCDGYAATAEAMQAASLSEVLDVDCSMALFSPSFEQPCHVEGQLMQLDPDSARLRRSGSAALLGGRDVEAGQVQSYAEAIREAAASNIPLGRPALRPGDFLPEKHWHVLASTAYICDDPYTGSTGVTQLADGVYRVTTRLATRKAASRIAFTFRLMEPLETARHVFSPLLVRFMSGVDHTTRPVKISDSGRIRNELQTMLSQALEHDGETVRVHFDRLDERVVPAREAGDHPQGAHLVPPEPPGLVRLARHGVRSSTDSSLADESVQHADQADTPPASCRAKRRSCRAPRARFHETRRRSPDT